MDGQTDTRIDRYGILRAKSISGWAEDSNRGGIVNFCKHEFIMFGSFYLEILIKSIINWECGKPSVLHYFSVVGEQTADKEKATILVLCSDQSLKTHFF